jgi:hypothetical protein
MVFFLDGLRMIGKIDTPDKRHRHCAGSSVRRVEDSQHLATGIDVGAHLRAVRTMYGMSPSF